MTTAPTPTDLPEALIDDLEFAVLGATKTDNTAVVHQARKALLAALTASAQAEAVDKESLTVAQPQAGAPAQWRDVVQRLSQFAHTAMHMSERDARNCLDDVAQRLADMLRDDASPTAPQAGAESYPPMPDLVELGRDKHGGRIYGHTIAQLRAFADATAALRSRRAVPSDADGFGSAEHWKEKAQYWAGVAHDLRQQALRGEPVDGIVQPPAALPGEQDAALPQHAGIYAWVSGHSAALVLVNKRPTMHAPGGQLNGSVMQSTKFYSGCAVKDWGRDGRWILLHDFDAARASMAAKGRTDGDAA